MAEARDFSYGGLESFTGTAGETVEFEMTNAGPAEHELVLIDPDGTVIGGVPRTPTGKTGRVTVEVEKAGTYTFVCFVDDHLARGMTGTLTVSSRARR